MIRAFQMIFSPGPAWMQIAEKNRSFLFTLFLSTLPLIVGCLAIEAYGLERLGEGIGEFGKVAVSREQILRYVGAELVGDLIVVIFGAYFLKSVSESFNARVTFSQSFNTVAIGASPIFLMHALDGVPRLDTWLCWGIGVGLTVRALYHGVAVNLKPEQTKGFGLYIVGVLIIGFMSGLAHFIAVSILHGKILR